MDKITKLLPYLLVILLFQQCGELLKFNIPTENYIPNEKLVDGPESYPFPPLKYKGFNLKEYLIKNKLNISSYATYYTYTSIADKLIDGNTKLIFENKDGVKIFKRNNRLMIYTPLNVVKIDYNHLSKIANKGIVGFYFILW